jgi:hypothetical protein
MVRSIRDYPGVVRKCGRRLVGRSQVPRLKISVIRGHEAPVLVSRGGLGFGTTALKRNFSTTLVRRDSHTCFVRNVGRRLNGA